MPVDVQQETARRLAILKATVLDNPFIPSVPTEKQADFVTTPQQEVLFGGAAGGGKSEAILMAALQYVEEPDYHALILRRTYGDLSLAGALMDRSKSWLSGITDAHWSAQLVQWKFPSGSTLTFGHLDTEQRKYRYQGAEFQFIGFDELTQFTDTQYRYLFSRLRTAKNHAIPLRMRAATNPGNVGHKWVKTRFIDTATTDKRRFVPSLLTDNPHLDSDEYTASLMELDPLTRQQLIAGDWNAALDGGIFKRNWFEIVGAAPKNNMTWVRAWDLAGTAPKKNKDPDYTAGLMVGLHRPTGYWYLDDLVQFRADPAGVESRVKQTAQKDGRHIPIRIEQEGGSSGKTVIDNYARKVFPGWNFRGRAVRGNKVERATPAAVAAEQGLVRLVRGKWNDDFLDEVSGFPQLAHDDVVDAFSHGFDEIASSPQIMLA